MCYSHFTDDKILDGRLSNYPSVVYPESSKQPWFRTRFLGLQNPQIFENCLISFVLPFAQVLYKKKVLESTEGNYYRRLSQRR